MAPIQIAYMPNPEKSGCVWRTDLGCSKASAVTRSWQSFTAHEFFETITDRTGPSAWVGVDAQTFQIQAEYAANASVIR